MLDALPHVNGLLNGLIAALIVAGFVAARRGRKRLHPRLMLAALGVGLIFVGGYVAQVTLLGHQRFPGEDWVRTLFLLILGTHTVLAVAVVPLVVAMVFLAWRGRFAAHGRLARVAFPAWLYVALTGVIIYWMNNHLRPG